jgi:2-keto-3-deoxy-galactonokinase
VVEERAKAQGANETAIFAMMALSSFSSGMIVTNAGWEKVNYAATPLIAIVIAALAFLSLTMKKSKT